MHGAVAVVVVGEVQPLPVFAHETIRTVHGVAGAVAGDDVIPDERECREASRDRLQRRPCLSLIAATGRSDVVFRRGLAVIARHHEQGPRAVRQLAEGGVAYQAVRLDAVVGDAGEILLRVLGSLRGPLGIGADGCRQFGGYRLGRQGLGCAAGVECGDRREKPGTAKKPQTIYASRQLLVGKAGDTLGTVSGGAVPPAFDVFGTLPVPS